MTTKFYEGEQAIEELVQVAVRGDTATLAAYVAQMNAFNYNVPMTDDVREVVRYVNQKAASLYAQPRCTNAGAPELDTVPYLVIKGNELAVEVGNHPEHVLVQKMWQMAHTMVCFIEGLQGIKTDLTLPSLVEVADRLELHYHDWLDKEATMQMYNAHLAPLNLPHKLAINDAGEFCAVPNTPAGTTFH